MLSSPCPALLLNALGSAALAARDLQHEPSRQQSGIEDKGRCPPCDT